jgi:hypothetical protein
MTFAERTLPSAVIEALTYQPTTIGPATTTPVDLAVLLPFFNGLLEELPWWSRHWRVAEVQPARRHEIAANDARMVTCCTEVSVPGTARDDAGQTLPFIGRVRFEGVRLLRVQLKVGDVVVGPALAPPGKTEQHPFGAVLGQLMALRGLTDMEMAYRCKRAMSTIAGLRTGGRNPHRILVEEVAVALDMAARDLIALAGLDPEPTGQTGRSA